MTFRRLFSISAVLGLSSLLSACNHEAPPDPRQSTPLVRAATVESSVPSARSFTGTIGARVQSDLGFRVPGKVVERLVDTGQAVRRGQLLMRIDPADLELALRVQQESVAAAQALARQTAAEQARYVALRGTGAVSASAHEQSKAAADTAAAQLKSAQAQAETARNATGYARLVADADGIVTETLAEPGQVVAAGQIVVRVARAGPREAIVQLPETVRPPVGSHATATLFGNAATFAASLRQLSNTADRSTRTFEARYVVDDALSDAPLGSTVTIRVAQGAAAGAQFSVPVSAVLDAGKGPGVWLIQEKTDRLAWRPVTIGRIEDDRASVTGKLLQGERIVALGAHLLREGQRVRTLGANVAGAGAQP